MEQGDRLFKKSYAKINIHECIKFYLWKSKRRIRKINEIDRIINSTITIPTFHLIVTWIYIDKITSPGKQNKNLIRKRKSQAPPYYNALVLFPFINFCWGSGFSESPKLVNSTFPIMKCNFNQVFENNSHEGCQRYTVPGPCYISLQVTDVKKSSPEAQHSFFKNVPPKVFFWNNWIRFIITSLSLKYKTKKLETSGCKWNTLVN